MSYRSSAPESQEAVFPGEGDLLIAESVGYCVHRAWLLREGLVTCTGCGHEIDPESLFQRLSGKAANWLGIYPSLSDAERAALDVSSFPGNAMTTFAKRYSTDFALENIFIGRLESAGWKSSFRSTREATVCVLSKGIQKFESQPHQTRHAALCDSLGKLLAVTPSLKINV
jgi:hypothetical protein